MTPSVSCIRADAMTNYPPLVEAVRLTRGATDGLYWEGLCGRVRPASSFSYRHAVEMYAGRITKPTTVAICEGCDGEMLATLPGSSHAG